MGSNPQQPRPLIVGEAASIVTIEKGVQGRPDTRTFDVASINDHITKSMAAIGPGEKVAFIAYADGEGVKGAIVGRISDGIPGDLKWTVFATKPYQGSFEWGMGLRWSI